ncbi:SCO family protein [Streptomyces sp. NPDC060194]|uniref:SCO family protein n=1 Tax=Streptomyces sp. NPDC060194 TaxID=3347069 RepID=UPI00364CEBF4
MRKSTTRRPARRNSLLAAALVSAALTLSACSGDGGDGGDQPLADVSGGDTSQQAATVLDKPYEKPDMILTDTSGEKFDLRARTEGKPTLIYFGYTHCPDVCPLTMSNIAIAEKRLPKAEQEDLQVVFVTTDPERDTPKHLGAWLKGAAGPDAIGLTGDFDTIQAGARSIGIGIEPPTKDKNGDVVSMHGAQVIAFSPKTDAGYVLYGEDTTADDYTKDMPKLVTGAKP